MIPTADAAVAQFNAEGYIILDLLDAEGVKTFRAAVRNRLVEIQKSVLPEISLAELELESYHSHPAMTDGVHQTLMNPRWRRLPLSSPLRALIQHPVMQAIIEYFRGAEGLTIKRVDAVGNMIAEVCNIHVVRPPHPYDHVTDYHTDGLNDGWCLGLWVPLSGFDSRYSLQVAPSSHLVRHPQSEITGGLGKLRSFQRQYIEQFTFVRPALAPGQAVFFHPNLIHGNARNEGEVTRVNIEAHFYPNNMTKPETPARGA